MGWLIEWSDENQVVVVSLKGGWWGGLWGAFAADYKVGKARDVTRDLFPIDALRISLLWKLHFWLSSIWALCLLVMRILNRKMPCPSALEWRQMHVCKRSKLAGYHECTQTIRLEIHQFYQSYHYGGRTVSQIKWSKLYWRNPRKKKSMLELRQILLRSGTSLPTYKLKRDYIEAILGRRMAWEIAQSKEPLLDEFGIVRPFTSDGEAYQFLSRNTNLVTPSRRLRKSSSPRLMSVSKRSQIRFGVAVLSKLGPKRPSLHTWMDPPLRVRLPPLGRSFATPLFFPQR